MRVGIAQIDGKWPNLALAKLAAYHRALGDSVELWQPLMEYDIIYASKVFTDTPDSQYLPDDAVRGGSGYDLSVTLPGEVEVMKPDWSLWTLWEKDMGFTTRGCPRRCGFCIVPKKEGELRVVAGFHDIWTGRKELVLLDNNLTAAPIEHFEELCRESREHGVALDFSQGLDARLLTLRHTKAIAGAKLSRKNIHLAFDDIRYEEYVRRAIALFSEAGIRPNRLMFYVLIGWNSTPYEDFYRILLLDALGVDPFVMRYRRGDPYQNRLSRWVNQYHIFRKMTWPQFNDLFRERIDVDGDYLRALRDVQGQHLRPPVPVAGQGPRRALGPHDQVVALRRARRGPRW